MKRRRLRAARPRPASGPASKPEWVGGAARAPFLVHDRPEPYRPGLALWFELPDGWVVGQAVQDPEETAGATLARALRDAMAVPAVGEPRRPEAIRIADAAAAAVVRAETAGGIPVTVAPTPELDGLFADLFEAMSDFDEERVEPSYLQDGRIPTSAVASLFEACGLLFGLRPWKHADEPPALRMDIPRLDVDGACVFVTGHDGIARGVLIFPSLEDFDAFLLAAEEEGYKEDWLGSEALSLTFDSAAELPQGMRREAMDHGWRVEGPDAYPVLLHVDAEGVPRPPTEREMEIAAACAEALAALLARHGGILSQPPSEPVCESCFIRDDLEVRFTVPYEGLDLFGLDSSAGDEFDEPGDTDRDGPFTPRAGRNEPCPCGSGRKYKKCCLPTEESKHAERRRLTQVHRMDAELVFRLSDFAAQEFPEAWSKLKREVHRWPLPETFTAPMSVYLFDVDDSTVADAFLADAGQRCTPEEQRWLEAQRRSWLSIWEVEDVEPGRSLELHDLLSGQRRSVRETMASRSLVRRDAILARVVDYDGQALLCSIHPTSLPPFDAGEVLDRARKRLRRKRAAPVERLRESPFCRTLIRYWNEAVEELERQRSRPTELRNMDDDPLAPTVDRFDLGAEDADVVRRLIGGLDGVRDETTGDDAPTYAFLRPDRSATSGPDTLIGVVRFDGESLTVETNSENRADALRQRLEAACGERIRHRERKQLDLPDLSRLQAAAGTSPATAPSPEDQRLELEHKALHYAAWVDVPLPALNGKTPREYARTAEGRRAVDRVLKQMENMEHRASGRNPFDFSVIREDLGIP